VPAIKFLLSGVSGVGLYYAIYWSLTNLGFHYYVSAVPAFVANNLSNFLFHKFWTFENRDMELFRRQLTRYCTQVAVFFVLNLAMLRMLVERVGLNYLLAQVFVTVILTLISYFTTRWIFRR